MERMSVRRSARRGASWWMGALLMTGCISSGSNSEIVSHMPAGTRFPEVVGINLEGDEVALPAGFEGTLNLVAIAYEREQQPDVDTWIPAAEQIAKSDPRVRFYEVPAINESNPLFRLWVNNGMRSGITDPAARRRTVTIYVDRVHFNRGLAIPDMSSIQVLLLDNAGRVLWRTPGPLSDHSLASLSRVLVRLGHTAV